MNQALLPATLFMLLLPSWALAAGGKHPDAKPSPKQPQANAAVEIPKTDRVIATVDNDPITMRDFEDYSRNSGMVPMPQIGTDEFKKLYDEFLMQLLVEREAKALNLSVADDDVNTYINQVKDQNHIDDSQLVELLKTKGMTLDGYRKQIREEILRTRLTQQHARTAVNVSEQDIKKQLGVTDGNHLEETHLWQIFVPLEDDGAGDQFKLAASPASSVSDEARDERKKVIEDILKRSKTVEELKSAGGSYFSDLGKVQADDLLEELRPAVTALSPGELSEIVETEKGFYLFGLAKVDSSAGAIDDDVRERTRRQLLEGKLRTEMEQYISKELPRKYNLERKL